MIKSALTTLAIAALSLGTVFGLEYFNLISTKYFAPRYEAVRRETFEQSKAYNQGTIQEIENFYLEYTKASDEHKKAIASIVLHRLADYDKTKLSPELQDFVAKLKKDY